MMLPVIKRRELIFIVNGCYRRPDPIFGCIVRLDALQPFLLMGMETIPKGLLRKIIREDLEMTRDAFSVLVKPHQG
jgi:hypothetical protein